MPDILMWLDQKDPSLPRIEEIPQEFEDGLKTVTAVAMQLGHEALTAEKIDLLDIRPLRSSATKKVVLHISPGDHRLRMPERWSSSSSSNGCDWKVSKVPRT
jgi:hypothetical protein